jgi:DNA polymerase-4
VLAAAAVSLLDRVEHDRAVRLLGVRLEMTDPETVPEPGADPSAE